MQGEKKISKKGLTNRPAYGIMSTVKGERQRTGHDSTLTTEYCSPISNRPGKTGLAAKPYLHVVQLDNQLKGKNMIGDIKMSKKTIDQIRDEVEAKRARFDAGSELLQQLEYVKRWYELEDGADLTTDLAKRCLAATEFLDNIASYILANI